jgi:hypothetical protein
MPNTTYGTPYAQSSDLVSNWPGVSLNVADRIDDISFKGNGLNDQTGTSYTLVLTDAGKTVTLNNAAAVTVTVPTNASVAYETGTQILFTNKGAGAVTIQPAGGVTLQGGNLQIQQYQTIGIIKIATDTWHSLGTPPSNSWTTYTPTTTGLTIGNGTLTAKYNRLSKLIFVRVNLVFGSTTSFSSVFSLTAPFAGVSGVRFPLTINFDDVSAGANWGGTCSLINSDIYPHISYQSGSWVRNDGGVTATQPFTWANTDYLAITGNYEEA